MNSIKLCTTVQTPSYIGMPISGRAFHMATDLVVRQRSVAATTWAEKRDMGLAAQSFPGTSAWRPPSC